MREKARFLINMIDDGLYYLLPKNRPADIACRKKVFGL